MQPSIRDKIHVVTILSLLISMAAHAADDSRPDTPNAVPAPNICGIGIGLSNMGLKNLGEGYEVTHVLPNSPAALSCEIQRGDMIIGVGDSESSPDDIDIRQISFVEVIKMIRGPVDSEVRVRLITKSSRFVKEKVVVLKRRPLYADGLIGKKLGITFTSLDDRTSLTVDKFNGRAVVFALWKGKSSNDLTKAFHNLADRTYSNRRGCDCRFTSENERQRLKAFCRFGF